MARQVTPAGDLALLTQALARQLPNWCARGKASTQHMSAGWVAGEFRSRRIVARGMERGDPRPYTIDDDPAMIDTARLPPVAAYDVATAIATGELRLVQAHHTVESEFVALVDLSRSMLEGFFDPWVMPIRRQYDAVKVPPLFYTVAAFLYLAASLGFRMRVICSQGRHIHEERFGAISSLLNVTLGRMRIALIDSQRRAAHDSSLSEPFNLAVALHAALRVRVRSVILVVSDFLDPFDDYHRLLAEVARRHHVILADVASGADHDYPAPRWFDLESQRVLMREGARHLEHNTLPRPNSSRRVREWNTARLKDKIALRQAVKRMNVFYEPIGAAVWSKYPRFGDFLRSYMLAFQRLQALQ
ncbi:MAG TPA: hypothetical protein VI386_05920 [Candidatus Sulfotelmatobacter sp.]